MTAIEKVIAFAEQWVGYLEKSKAEYQKDHSIVYEKVRGAGRDNYTMVWEDVRPAFHGQPWCQGFIFWIFYRVFGADAAKDMLYLSDWKGFESWNNFACMSWADNFERHGARYQSSKAQVGDIIYFTKSHTGIVYDIKDGYVYTIEGNTSVSDAVISNGGGVCKKKYRLGIDAIYCYGRPDYGKAPKEEERPTIYKGYKDSECGGTWCQQLQHSLNELEITDDNGKALVEDGSCGGKTVQAIKALQAEAIIIGLYDGEVDGVCGKKTWKALDAMLTTELPREAKETVSFVKGKKYHTGEQYNGYVYIIELDIYVPAKYIF